MKKSVIFLTILLVASLAGTYAVYELYVKERMQELADRLDRERQLAAKIETLQSTFFRTQPQVVLQEWRSATQPWSDAVDRRTSFFAFDRTLDRVKIPEEKIPRFFYREEIPKRIQALQDYADQKNVDVADVTCGVPPADNYPAGTNPPPAEIEGHFWKFDYCAGLTRMLIDAGPESLQPLVIWPDQDIQLRTGGTLRERTIGVRMRIRMEPLIRFLDSVSQSDRYFRVHGLKISNNDLTVRDPVLNVELLLIQARYMEPERRTTQTVGGQQGSQQSQALITDLFGGTGGFGNRERAEEDSGPSAWQRFRKRFLPF